MFVCVRSYHTACGDLISSTQSVKFCGPCKASAVTVLFLCRSAREVDALPVPGLSPSCWLKLGARLGLVELRTYRVSCTTLVATYRPLCGSGGMRTGNSEEPRVDAGTAIPTDQQQASSYGPARSVRKNSVGRWIHSATGRWLTREEIRAATDIAGTNTGTPLIIPRVVDANSGTVIRNPIPQISLLDPSAMQQRPALSVNSSNAIQQRKH